MSLFRILLLPLLVLLAACNIQNTKSISANEAESVHNLKELIKLRQDAQAAYQNKNWAKSVEYYGRLSLRVPKDAEIWFRLGNGYARLKNYGAAIQSYQQALILDSKNGKVWHNMGIVQLELATNTFIEMKNNTSAEDPLNKRASNAINAISNLLEQDFGVSSKN